MGRAGRNLPARALVVTGPVPAAGGRPRAWASLVETLAQCPSTRVTLACADGFGAARYGGNYQRQGVEVVAGPVDWLARYGGPALPLLPRDRQRRRPDHPTVADRALDPAPGHGGALFRAVAVPLQALGESSWHTEGTETVTEIGQNQLLRQVEGLHAAWCASAADASLLAGLGRAVKG